MNGLDYFILFVFGTAVGSFLNVVILRFDPEADPNQKLFTHITGRSHCMACGKILNWYELIPVLSFMVQFGRCRGCRSRLKIQYPVVEMLAGLVFVAVPYVLIPLKAPIPYLEIGLWLIAMLTLLLISVIDLRLYIIPDGLNITLGILAVVNFAQLYLAKNFGEMNGLYHSLLGGTSTMVAGTFLGASASFLFFMSGNIWLNFILGGVFGGLFFGAIYFLSQGRAMGFGDVKMALAAGFLLGLPDMILATMLAFITGAAYGLVLMMLKIKGIKSHVPFGPFIALGITLVVFFGYDIIYAYFKFFSFLG